MSFVVLRITCTFGSDVLDIFSVCGSRRGLSLPGSRMLFRNGSALRMLSQNDDGVLLDEPVAVLTREFSESRLMAVQHPVFSQDDRVSLSFRGPAASAPAPVRRDAGGSRLIAVRGLTQAYSGRSSADRLR